MKAPKELTNGALNVVPPTVAVSRPVIGPEVLKALLLRNVNEPNPSKVSASE